jgi:short-subunit dehydrogenase
MRIFASRFEGRRAVVTGASGGIGRAAAVRLASAGAVVVVVARSAELLDELVAEIAASGGTAYASPCDLTDLDQVDALVTKVLDRHDHVDVLVNNAGMSIRRKVRHSVDRFHDFERPMQLNYFAAVRLTMGLLPTMVERESGQVVNISSWAAVLRPARFSGYAASKAALEAWSDSVQGEVLDDGIVFTNVHMPLVRTPMIAPTKLYRRMPALTVDEAANVVCDAVVSRSRRVTPLAAGMISWAESISPALGDLIRKNAI